MIRTTGDLRDELSRRRVYQSEVAARLGMTRVTLSTILNADIPVHQKWAQAVLEAADAVKEGR